MAKQKYGDEVFREIMAKANAANESKGSSGGYGDEVFNQIMASANAASHVKQANRFIVDVNKFSRAVEEDTSGENQFNAADYFEERKKQAEQLKQRAAAMTLYMDDHRDSFSEDSYERMMNILSTFDTDVDDVMSRYQPSLDSKAGMRAYEDELMAAMERNDQMRANQQSALFAFDPSQPTGFFDKLQQYTDDQSYRFVTDKWTDEERYELGMRQMEDPVKAAEFAANVNSYHNALATEPERQKIREQAAQNLWKNTGKALLASTFSAQDQFMDRMAEYAARGQTTEKDYVTPWDYAQETTGAISQKLNENAIGSDRYNEISGIMQEGLKENGVDLFYRNQDSMQTANDMFEGRGIGDLYNLGYSMAQNTLSRYSFGAIPGVGEAATLANYFASAATSGIDEARRMGADGDQAVASGIAKGTWEVATEVLGLDNLYKMGPAITWGDLFNQLGIQGLFEAFGEGANSALGYLSDYYILGDLSEYAQSVQSYMEQGETAETAKRKAFLDAAKNVGFEALSGEVSGWVSGGIETGYKTGLENQYYRNVNPQALIDLGMTAGEDTAAFKLAQQMQGQIAEGQKPTGNEKRVLAYNIDLMNLAAQKVEAEMATAKMTAEQIEGMKPTTSADGNARQISRNESINVNGFAEVKDGKATVRLKEGGTVDYQDVSFGTDKQANQYFAVESLPVIDTAHANDLLKTIQDADVGKDTAEVVAIRESYRLGYMGATTQELRGSDAQILSTNLQDQIYNIGKEQRTANDAVRAAASTARTKATAGYKKVVIEGKLSRVTRDAAKKRKAEIEYVDRIADTFAGTAVHVYESYEKNGKRYYKDNSGKEQLAPNGKYVNDEIWLDLKSGDNGDGLMLNTFAHEMYHHIEKWNKPKARELAEFVVKELGLESVDKAVAAQIEKARAAGYGEEHFKGMSPEQARNEVYMRAMSDFVADSLETMFTRGDPAKAIANLKKENKGLFDQIKAFIDEWISKVKKFYSDKTISQEGAKVAQMEKFEQLQQLFMEAMAGAGENYNASLKELTPGEAGIMVNEAGEPVAMSTEDGSVMLSIRTYEEDGRKAFRGYLNKCVTSNRLTEEQAKEMRDGIEEIYNVCKEFKDKYAPFSTWSDAEVIRDTRGRPVFSVVTPNGDYKMNLDFSLVCKKRRTLDAVFNEMSRRGIIDDFELGQKSVVKINEIIRKHGLETACALCFVDAKRFRQASMADSFTRLYNELVESLVPEDQKGSIDHFNFSGYETIKKVDGGIDSWDNSKLDFSHLDKVMKEYGKGTVEHKAAKYIKNNPKGRKLLLRGDFMSSQGFDAVKSQNQDILKLYNSKKGTGGPKAAFGDVQYLNEIIKKERTWTPSKAYEVGGIRIQSFSDYVPRMVFDYTQMIYDLAARKLPAHAYTKESLFVKQFGLTGVKINMSLIPAVVDGGIAAGLDAKGNYVWAGESFNYDEAVEIQNAEGYSENCGTICVGVSKQHIEKLLRDPNIRMVIPYHKSGLNPIVAHMNKIAEFTDYTNDQRTKGKDGKAVSKDFNFNEAVKRTGDPKAAADEYLKWCKDNGYTAKFAEFATEENYYKLLEDFTLYDKDGKYVPQREVRAVFPAEGYAFGTMRDLIESGLEEDAIVEGKREKNLSSIVDEIQRTLPKTEAEISEEQVVQADRDLEAQYSLRNQQPTAREILMQTDPQPQKNNVKGHLARYQERVVQLNKAETRRKEVRSQIEALAVDSKKNRKELAQLRTENRNLTTQINGLKEKLKFSENTDMMRKIVANERLKNQSPAKFYKDEQEDFVRSMLAEHRVIRKELTGADSVMFVMEDTFVKLAKDYEAKKIDMKTMEKEFMRIINEYEKQTEKSGKQAKADSEKIETLTAENKIWLREYKRLMKEYDLSDRKIARLEATIQRQRATAKARVEGRRKTEMRHKIQRKANELDRLLRHGTKHRNVPEFLQSSVAAVLDAINMEVRDGEQRLKTYEATIARYDRQIAAATDPATVSRLIEKRNEYAAKGDQFANRMDTLKKAYDQIRKENTDLELDEGIAEHLNSLFETVGDTPLGQMNAEQMNAVNDVLNITMATIRNANKMFQEAQRSGVEDNSKLAMREIRSVGGGAKKRTEAMENIEKFGWNNLKPVQAFETIGSSVLNRLFNNLRSGEDTLARDLEEGKNFFRNQWQKYNGENWDTEKKWKFTSTSGKAFELDLNQIMSLYALAKRDQARDHLRVGGFTFDSQYKVKDEIKVGPVKINAEVKNTDASAYNLSDEILGEIIGTLTTEQRAFVDAMQEYLSDNMAAKGNEISLKKYGIRLFKDKNYFPLRVADQYMAKVREQQTGDRKLKNSGFTQAVVPHAKNPVVLSAFTEIWAEHVDEMSLYHSFVLPLDDLSRVLNYHDAYTEETSAGSVVEAIKTAYGEAATQYIDKLIRDVNGGSRTDSVANTVNKMLSKVKKAQTMASLSVAIQQPSAVLRAMAMIDSRYFIGAKVTEKSQKRTWDEIKKHAPIAIIKEMGGFDTNVGQTTVDYLTDTSNYEGMEKVTEFFKDKKYRDEVFGMLPAKMDEWAWGIIWNAAKREIKDQHPNMDVNGNAFWKLVADRFTDVIVHTQVYDSVFSRSGMMRSKDTGVKMVTSFMAEPTTTANMLAMAIIQAKRGDISKRQVGRVVGSIAASIALNSFLVSFVYAMRDDDEDERFDEKWIRNFWDNVWEGINPLNYIPIARDGWSIMQGFDVDRADMSLFDDLRNAINGLKDEDLSPWEKTEAVLGAVGNILGVPMKNLLRDSSAIYKTFKLIGKDPKTKTSTGRYIARKGMDLNNGEEMILALQRDDMEHIQRVFGRYESQEKAESALQSAIGEKYRAGEMSAEEATQLLTDYFDREEYEVYWILDKWDYARENGNTDGYTKYGTFFEAIDSGEDYTAEMDRLMAHGAEASDIRSQISRKYRKQYLEDETAREEIREKLLPVYEATGMYASEIEDKFNDWDFEAEYGMTYGEMKGEFRDGNVTEAELRSAMDFYGLLNYEIEEGIRDLNKEIKFFNKYGMSMSEMTDAYDHGDVSRNTMIGAKVFNGMTKKEAQEWVNQRDISNSIGIDFMELDDAYKYSDISRTTLRNAILKNGETPEKTDEAMMGYDWLKKNVRKYPDLAISDAKKFAVRIHSDYAPDETLEDYGVSIDAYIEYQRLRPECKGVDANGDGKTDDGTLRDSVFRMIDSLPISSEAKDGLALMSYSAKSIRRNAPWH